jgi:hypothetical protein
MLSISLKKLDFTHELKYYGWQTKRYTCHQYSAILFCELPLEQSCSWEGILSFSYVVTQPMNIADSQMGGVPYGLNRRRKSETLRAQYIDVNELRHAFIFSFLHFLDLNLLAVIFLC